jgi:hypothetical protein
VSYFIGPNIYDVRAQNAGIAWPVIAVVEVYKGIAELLDTMTKTTASYCPQETCRRPDGDESRDVLCELTLSDNHNKMK